MAGLRQLDLDEACCSLGSKAVLMTFSNCGSIGYFLRFSIGALFIRIGLGSYSNNEEP